ncbi:hypothetical protein CDT96_02625 [Cronobacter sakazakii]|nr:hypothetical protein CDT96_02625 [Cronobacter sakazakii]
MDSDDVKPDGSEHKRGITATDKPLKNDGKVSLMLPASENARGGREGLKCVGISIYVFDILPKLKSLE